MDILPGSTIALQNAYRRYLKIYNQVYCNCTHEDKVRLRQTFIKNAQNLYHSAPVFSVTKLPTLINHACTRLGTRADYKEIHKIHRCFLLILDSLIRGQPDGEMDFDTECKRIEQRDKIIDRIKELKKERTRLLAAEVDLEKEDSTYIRIETVARQIVRLSKALLKLEPEERETESFFIRVEAGSFLSKLTNETRDTIQNAIAKMIAEREDENTISEKPEVFAEIDRILGVLVPEKEKLGILDEVYKSVLEYQRHNRDGLLRESHEELLRDPALRPKYGHIWDDQSALEQCPPTMNLIFNENRRRFNEKFKEVINSSVSGKRPSDSDESPQSKICALEDCTNGPNRGPRRCADEDETADDIVSDDELDKEDEEFDLEGEEEEDEEGEVEGERDRENESSAIIDEEIEIIKILGGHDMAQKIIVPRVKEEPKWEGVPAELDLIDPTIEEHTDASIPSDASTPYIAQHIIAPQTPNAAEVPEFLSPSPVLASSTVQGLTIPPTSEVARLSMTPNISLVRPTAEAPSIPGLISTSYTNSTDDQTTSTLKMNMSHDNNHCIQSLFNKPTDEALNPENLSSTLANLASLLSLPVNGLQHNGNEGELKNQNSQNNDEDDEEDDSEADDEDEDEDEEDDDDDVLIEDVKMKEDKVEFVDLVDED